MISVTDFISYEEVRAVLGLSSFELPDETLELPMFQRALAKSLRAITGTYNETSMNLIAVFDFLSAKAVLTDTEEATLDAINQMALYTVAATCLTGLNLTALKAITDGKSSEARFNYDKIFLEVEAKVRRELGAVTDYLWNAVGVSTTAAAPILSVVPPLTDRVTG